MRELRRVCIKLRPPSMATESAGTELRHDRPSLLEHMNAATRSRSFSKRPACLTRSSRSTSARATSSSPGISSRSRRTTAFRGWSINEPGPRRQTDLDLQTPARCCCTSPRRPANFCPPTFYGRYSHDDPVDRSGRWAGLGPMAGQNHHFRNYAQEKIKLRHRPLCRTRPTGSMACSTSV